MSRILSYSASTLLSLVMSASVFAGESEAPLTVKEDAPKTYTVIKGDTLWDISAMYLDSPWLWPRLWQVNPDIDNPHLIYPGDKLSLIWRNGQPVLSLKSMVKLSPKVRVLEKEAVPTLNKGLVLPYLESDRLIDKAELDKSERVLGSSKGKKYLTQQELLYISGSHTHTEWSIYRPVAEFERGEQVMIALKRVASAKLVESDEAMTGLSVLNQVQEVQVDDIALPDVGIEILNLSTTFYPVPSPENSVAHILGSLDGSQYVGQNQVVVIDRGEEDDLRQGSMFELYEIGSHVVGKKHQSQQLSQASDDKLKLPDTKVGNLMVIRPYPHFSLALVTQSTQPIGKATEARAPIIEAEAVAVEPIAESAN